MTPSHRSGNPRAVSKLALKEMHSALYPDLYTAVPIAIKKTTLSEIFAVKNLTKSSYMKTNQNGVKLWSKLIISENNM